MQEPPVEISYSLGQRRLVEAPPFRPDILPLSQVTPGKWTTTLQLVIVQDLHHEDRELSARHDLQTPPTLLVRPGLDDDGWKLVVWVGGDHVLAVDTQQMALIPSQAVSPVVQQFSDEPLGPPAQSSSQS